MGIAPELLERERGLRQALGAGRREMAEAEPIVTPATKSVSGHDLNIDWAQCCETSGKSLARKVREAKSEDRATKAKVRAEAPKDRKGRVRTASGALRASSESRSAW